jgi:hypothetical protein
VTRRRRPAILDNGTGVEFRLGMGSELFSLFRSIGPRAREQRLEYIIEPGSSGIARH